MTRWRLPPVLFPIAAFTVWRVVHLLLVVVRWENASVGPTFRYDGQRYLDLLERGYADAGLSQPNTAFFPLVSWLGAAVRFVIRDEYAAGMLVANLAALTAFVALWAVVREWRGDGPARAAVVLLALWPTSFFLWSFYSEALFIATSAGAFWADRVGRRRLAAVLVALAAMTRVIGITVGVVLVAGRVLRRRRLDRVAVAYAAAAVAGLGLVMVVMGLQAGDPLAFVGAQADWGRSASPPWETVANGFRVIDREFYGPVLSPTTAQVLDLVAVGLVVVSLVWVGWPGRDDERRWPFEAWLLLLLLALVPLCSTWLYSFNRFMIDDWVVFAALGDLAVVAWRRTRWALLGWLVVGVAAVPIDYWMLEHWLRNHFIG